MKKAEIRPFILTADATNGAKSLTEYYATIEEAKKQGDYLHNHPGVMNVEITGPAYAGPKVPPTEHDIAVGAWMAASLDDRKVCPSMKYDINVWMDSKSWP